MADSTHNFGAGPAALPGPVLARIADELGDLGGSGLSILEVSHRSDAFRSIAEHAEADLRDLIGIPAEYHVLFVQGGATLQFSAIPLNLAPEGSVVDHLVTGFWSERAAREARRLARVNVAADGAASGYRSIPDPADWRLTPGAEYVAYTVNETIDGVEFPYVPETGDVPLVADASSTILSRPLDVSPFGLVYAGAQKNLGVAGLTVVIVRDALIGRARPDIPTLLDYAQMASSGSMLNTPPTFSWYVAGLVLDWVRSEGGLEAMEARNTAQKARLYRAIDDSDLYENAVDAMYRSWTTIPFSVADPAAEKPFLEEAARAGLVGLEGHRSVGGLRAALYNAMPDEGVDALIDFMGHFESRWHRRPSGGAGAG